MVDRILRFARDTDLHVEWQASLQRKEGGLRICWRMHDAYHCLPVEKVRELRDILTDLLLDAEFVSRTT
jgi:hypothetical protein